MTQRHQLLLPEDVSTSQSGGDEEGFSPPRHPSHKLLVKMPSLPGSCPPQHCHLSDPKKVSPDAFGDLKCVTELPCMSLTLS